MHKDRGLCTENRVCAHSNMGYTQVKGVYNNMVCVSKSGVHKANRGCAYIDRGYTQGSEEYARGKGL